MVSETPTARAIAMRCSTALVDPPSTVTSTMAFSKAARVMMSRGLMSFSSKLRIAAPERTHSSSFSGSSAGVEDDVATLGLVDVARQKFAVALERAHHVELGTLGSAARANRAAIDHEGGAIQASHGHDAAGHVLIAAGDGDGRVVPLRPHDGFDGIGDQVA